MPHVKRRLEAMPHLQNYITEAMGRCGIKNSHHPATGGHQTGGPIEEEEVQDLPSCQRQKSQQLVFPVHQTCVQGAQKCSCHLLSTEMAIWDGAVPKWFYCVSFIFFYLVTFTTINYRYTTVQFQCYGLSVMCMLCPTKWLINIFQVLNVLV